MIKITNIYDNNQCGPQLMSDWGFGCIIDHPAARIIFDTGANPEILQQNMKMLSIEPSDIDVMIISHKHWDHRGGAAWLSQQNNKIKVYMPKSWNSGFDKQLSSYGVEVNIVQKNLYINNHFCIVVSENIWIRELVLVIDAPKGSIVLTGCSHTGIDNIIKNVQNDKQRKIAMLFGGFHLFRTAAFRINMLADFLKKMNVGIVAPCHCTGDRALKVLQEKFGENFLVNGVGAEYTFEI